MEYLQGLQCDDQLFSDLIAALSMVLDVEEERKLFHGWRVAAVVGLALRASGERGLLAEAFYGGLLHDIGAMGLPDHVTHYPTLESQVSVPEILAHPARGAAIVAEIPGLEGVSPFILEHHEYWDGSGYPAGKKDGDISFGAHLLRAGDAFDLALRAEVAAGHGTPRDLKDRVLARMSSLKAGELSPAVVELISAVVEPDSTFMSLVDVEALGDLIAELRARIPLVVPSCKESPGHTVLTIFSRVIDAKHRYTAGHSQRVADYSVAIGLHMGLSPGELEVLEASALLHDTGKVSVPRSILDKSGPLTPAELALIRRHASLTIEILGTISRFEGIAWVAGHHHERYDGGGYPHGLRGDEIPLGARIIAVADAFDAMTSSRPYQKTYTAGEAMRVLAREAGRQFDPDVIEAAVHALKPSLVAQALSSRG
ncbi:MAG TPA: HD domain-containing protein [Firmicutes bacterium]|nr:HD domain-containing protein [Bacillota bacterium]